MDRRAVLEKLRSRIRAIEGMGRTEAAAVFGLGVPEIDAHLPWGGLPFSALHEVSGAAPFAASGFAAALMGRAGARGGALLWCRSQLSERDAGRIYGPGLATFGIDHARLILVRGRHDRDVLWAMQEGLRTPGVTAVLGEVQTVDLARTRKLQLAAEAGGAAGLILRSRADVPEASAAVTRWQATRTARTRTQARAEGGFSLVWDVELRRCRGAMPAAWRVMWDEQALRFDLARAVADGPAALEPAAARAG